MIVKILDWDRLLLSLDGTLGKPEVHCFLVPGLKTPRRWTPEAKGIQPPYLMTERVFRIRTLVLDCEEGMKNAGTIYLIIRANPLNRMPIPGGKTDQLKSNIIC